MEPDPGPMVWIEEHVGAAPRESEPPSTAGDLRRRLVPLGVVVALLSGAVATEHPLALPRLTGVVGAGCCTEAFGSPGWDPVELWGGRSGMPPTIVGDSVLVSEGATIRLLDLADGARRWSYEFDARDPIAVADEASGVVVIRSISRQQRHIVALDVASGAVLWERRNGPLVFVDRGALFVSTSLSDGTGVGDPRSGEVRWTLGEDLLAGDESMWVVKAAGGLTGVDATSGESRWSIAVSGVVAVGVADDLVATLSTDVSRRVASVRLDGVVNGVGSLVWESAPFAVTGIADTTASGPFAVSIARTIGRVEVQNGDTLMSIDLASGTTMWRERGFGQRSVHLDNRIVGCDETGGGYARSIRVADRLTGAVVADTPIEGQRCWLDSLVQSGTSLLSTDDRMLTLWDVERDDGEGAAVRWGLDLAGSVRRLVTAEAGIVVWTNRDEVRVYG